MFGSLVVVFPTPHEGGELVLRHEGKEWTFDSARLLTGHSDRIAFAAFFSDVEHEVLPVRTGHRVNLTYNLYFADASSPPKRVPPAERLDILQPTQFNFDMVRDALLNFLSNTEVLPDGGTLAFALRHMYPVPIVTDVWTTESQSDLVGIVRAHLKGSDAALYEACHALGLQPKLRLFMQDLWDQDDKFLFDDIKALEAEPWEGSPYGIFKRKEDVTLVKDGHLEGESDTSASEPHTIRPSRAHAQPVYWVTPHNKLNNSRWPFVGYGNQAGLAYEYVAVCLVAEAPPAEERKNGVRAARASGFEGVKEEQTGAPYVVKEAL